MLDILRFACGHCGKQLSVKPQHAGRSTRCPGCQYPVTVPYPDPEPIQADNLNVLDVFPFQENTANASNVGEDTKSALDAEALDAVQPVSNPADVNSDDAISRLPSPPTVAKVLRRYGGLPRTAIISGGTLLVVLGVFFGWYLLKPPTAKESFQVILEAAKKRAGKKPECVGNTKSGWARRRMSVEFVGYDIKTTDSIIVPFTAKVSYLFTLEAAYPKGGKADAGHSFADKKTAAEAKVDWAVTDAGVFSDFKPLARHSASFKFDDGKWTPSNDDPDKNENLFPFADTNPFYFYTSEIELLP